jgi:hypothetical protein
MNEPIDQAHADSMAATEYIRQQYREACKRLGLTPKV